MKLTGLSAISPIDGRYRRTTESLSEYFSEFGLIRYRVQVEVEYFIFLSQQKLKQFPKLNAAQVKGLRKIYQEFTEHDAQHIKDTEKITNHDVKAVEYFLKEKLITLNLSKFTEFIHFGLTSQDINNTSIPLSLKEGTEKVIDPALDSIRKTLTSLSKDWKNIALLAHTHGQPASPTRLGKEMYVFVDRLNAQMKQFQNIPYSAKFGGATGNLNAHFIAFPKKDWNKFADDFVNKELGLCRSQFTTQIEHYDNIAAYCDALKRINVIL
ncbi:MAG TPA: lyase family protein, partial [Bacteroidia bacterium]|nr:lyase family protein [Bacteroidia bacterium]